MFRFARRSITPEQLSRALAEVAGCEACSPNGGEIPFDCLLVEVVEPPTENVDFIMPGPAKCPRCQEAIHSSWHLANVNGTTSKLLLLALAT
jgi:hypothetical protein